MEDSIALINQSTCPTATTAPSVTEYFEGKQLVFEKQVKKT